ncbi:DUF6172 family protein [Roseateles sp.]|jgi:hypothetical protein|uniref:DUF6172 family protein n=1 Tax=Roseateles sp. TaxID=1971397 RepID=UPI0037C9F2AD
MKKTFQLQVEGKNPERLLEAIKHEIRQYLKRERRKPLPAQMDFWDFDCRFGLSEEEAEVIHVGAFIDRINEAAAAGAPAFYLELLAKPAQRRFVPRAPGAEASEA